MSKPDLDAVMARYKHAEESASGVDAYITAARWGHSAADVPALVAELRAAREAVEAGREIRNHGHRSDGYHCMCRLCSAVDDYDAEITGESQ